MRRILDGHFFTFICCKNCLFEKMKINEKEVGHIFYGEKKQNKKKREREGKINKKTWSDKLSN